MALGGRGHHGIRPVDAINGNQGRREAHRDRTRSRRNRSLPSDTRTSPRGFM